MEIQNQLLQIVVSGCQFFENILFYYYFLKFYYYFLKLSQYQVEINTHSFNDITLARNADQFFNTESTNFSSKKSINLHSNEKVSRTVSPLYNCL